MRSHVQSTSSRIKRRPLLQVETLEDRLPMATDVQLQAFTAAGQAELTVRYEIIGDAPGFLTLDFLVSADAVWDSGDVSLDQVILDAAEDLTAGEHTKTFALGVIHAAKRHSG